jgi:beta-glucosidase
MPEMKTFPTGFTWGTATAAYQIEGAAREDGRGESIWDVFSRTPGRVLNGDTGDFACDHYHRWKDDIRMMKDLGFKAYRFSIAWPRILPQGRGRVNQAGLDFYNRLIDELLQANIRPMITLYHWDIPTALPGAWLERSVVDAFTQYTTVVARAFGDRVKEWVTINEPWCASILSYKLGIHAPGLTDHYKALVAAHHLLLAHGRALPILRAECPGARAGIALNLSPIYPHSKSEADIAAARFADGELARWFLDPLYGRGYPADIIAGLNQAGVLNTTTPHFIQPGDMDTIAAPADFLAVNYYSRNIVKASPGFADNSTLVEHIPPPKNNQTDIGWEIYPSGLFEVLNRVYIDYKPAELIISENGASYSDGPDAAGNVHDIKRIDYLRGHLLAVWQAIASGIPVTGYYAWSLMDNFEWSLGYSQRFGLIHVDYATQKRTPKDSALWYSQVTRQNGIRVT